MADTPNYNLPYPSDYTEVADVPEAIKDLAEAADAALEDKVNTEMGKGLSSNDFTNNFKEKLNGIETGAEVNVIEGITLNGSALIPTGKIIALIGIERSTNKVTSVSSSSTDTEYPSALAVYTYVNTIVGDIATLLDEINGENI